MKIVKRIFAILFCLFLVACGSNESGGNSKTDLSETQRIADLEKSIEDLSRVLSSEEALNSSLSESLESAESKIESIEELLSESEAAEESLTPEPTPQSTPTPAPPDPFSFAAMPKYADYPYEYVNDGVPYFNESDLTDALTFSPLDNKNRPGQAFGLLGIETLPTEPRGENHSVTPVGWNDIEFEEIDGGHLFNRCHLIAWSLCGENANACNLITGTRYLNMQGMNQFEAKTLNYINTTGNHVLYRVTPIYNGDVLIPNGVLMEGLSVEDDGLAFCVYCFNVQPDVFFSYFDGHVIRTDFHEIIDLPETGDPQSAEPESAESQAEESSSEIQEIIPDSSGPSYSSPEETTRAGSGSPTYIANMNTKKFHRPNCASVKRMADHNKKYYYGSREELIHDGYVPCKNCNP